MQLRWQLPIALRSHSIWGCVKLKYMFPVRVMAVNQPFVLFTPVVSKLLKSSMLPRFHTMVAGLRNAEECNKAKS